MLDGRDIEADTATQHAESVMTAEPESFSPTIREEPGTGRPDGSTSLDPARERRVKALTCTEPLHDLRANRSRRNWETFDF